MTATRRPLAALAIAAAFGVLAGCGSPAGQVNAGPSPTSPQHQPVAALQAGAAAMDITPPPGYPMWGYARRHDAPCLGVLDPLRARALVLAAGAQRIALVSLDLGRPPTRRSTAAIRASALRDSGIAHLFLAASHTHHGPVLELDNWPPPAATGEGLSGPLCCLTPYGGGLGWGGRAPSQPYVTRLENKLVDLIRQAARSLRPARLGVASKEIALNRNRHSHRPDAPIDRQLLVLRVEDTTGKPIALAVNYAAHAILQDPRDRRFSADYPGALCTLVEKETGVPCLFLQGAAGDLSPDAGSYRGPNAYGQALGREALALSRAISCPPAPGFTIQATEDGFRFRTRVDLSNPGVRLAYATAFYPALVDFYEREYRDGIRPHLTTALLNGTIGVVGVSGEFFSAHALRLRQRARLEQLLFVGYCNDYQQYFPTIEAAAEGGYGADPRMAPAEPGAGEHIIDRALVRLYRMRGRLPTIPPEKQTSPVP